MAISVSVPPTRAVLYHAALFYINDKGKEKPSPTFLFLLIYVPLYQTSSVKDHFSYKLPNPGFSITLCDPVSSNGILNVTSLTHLFE